MIRKNNNPTIVVITGIPGSGKSYYANKLVKAHKHSAIIVNRDGIRSMLGEYWVPSRESLVSILEQNTIKEGLKANYDVIVDATNLNPKTIKSLTQIASTYNADITYHSIVVSPINAYIKVLWRTMLGGRYISYKVIKGFYDRYF